MKKATFMICVLWTALSGHSQEKALLLDDTTFFESGNDVVFFQESSNLDPQRAALLSAVLPGLGQAYNRQYWKIPLVVTGMIGFAHYINYNNKVYHALRNAAIIEVDGGENPYEGIISSTEGLVRNRDNFRRNRDFLIVLGSVFYVLQIVDAHVSAHLDEFNVNDDLVMGIRPSIQSTPLFSQAVGFSLVLKF